jgi:SAM-dependent methyltransferase
MTFYGDLMTRLLPQSVISNGIYATLSKKIRRYINRLRSPKGVFNDIYSRNRWGGERGEMYSGSGSRGEAAVQYANYVKDFILSNNIKSVVDLGCGDFFIGQQIAIVVESYVGIDVVPSLIEFNNKKFGSDNVSFICADITSDNLPEGTLCLVRQVLQHMSNAQIARLLSRLRKYELVIITEHQPGVEDLKIPNIDKVHGDDTRLYKGSGVYLDKDPFNVSSVRLLFEYSGSYQLDSDDVHKRGSIRSFLIGR